jgi:hypothetical protein
MLPRWHIFWGAIFTAVIWFFAPELNLLYLALIFFASFLIDFDHYAVFAHKNKKLSLLHALKEGDKMRKSELLERKKGIKRRGHFFVFHTIEFHTLVALLGLAWQGFFFIFIGMVFHSLLDLAELLHRDRFYRREYFFFNWLRKRIF